MGPSFAGTAKLPNCNSVCTLVGSTCDPDLLRSITWHSNGQSNDPALIGIVDKAFDYASCNNAGVCSTQGFSLCTSYQGDPVDLTLIPQYDSATGACLAPKRNGYIGLYSDDFLCNWGEVQGRMFCPCTITLSKATPTVQPTVQPTTAPPSTAPTAAPHIDHQLLRSGKLEAKSLLKLEKLLLRERKDELKEEHNKGEEQGKGGDGKEDNKNNSEDN